MHKAKVLFPVLILCFPAFCYVWYTLPPNVYAPLIYMLGFYTLYYLFLLYLTSQVIIKKRSKRRKKKLKRLKKLKVKNDNN